MKKRSYIKRSSLTVEQRKTFKFLLDKGVNMVEVKYTNTATWEEYFLAEYENLAIEFSFSNATSPKEHKWIIDSIWERLINQDITKVQ